ncbi:MAG: metallopeptidase family protein [Verrucomicrobiae bacterium]|nr:metallopeptidase family protein [Verrucomicrobiae bacterium]
MTPPRNNDPKPEETGIPHPSWDLLRSIAEAEVESTIRRLPKPLRTRAASIPVICEARPSRRLIADGYDPDLLGLFVGGAFGDDMVHGPPDLPAQILLFLENLWDVSEGDYGVFREEVRTTYLHELGHYLGLDEIELGERGLE